MKTRLMPREINHKGLFMFGVVYYFLIPLVIIQTDFLNDSPGINTWKSNALDDNHIIIYLALVFLLIIFFYSGSYLAQKYSNPRLALRRELGSLSSKLVIFITAIFIVCTIYQLRGSAFTGDNGGGSGDGGLQGILSTAGLLIFYLHFSVHQSKLSKNICLILFVITAAFLLSLGGRMYVIIPLVAYFMRSYNTAAKKGKSLLPYLLIPIFIALSAGIVGVLRLGEKFDLVLYIIFAEPVFTSYSALSFINYDVIRWFQMPKNFFVSALNFVPSLVWSNKSEVLGSWSGNWTKFDNPLGALSIFTSIYGDFGIVFGCVFIFLIGAFFGYLYKAFKNNSVNANIYYCYCAVLPFSFFRDPIGIPLKIFITSFGIIPFLIQMLRQLLKKE